MSKLTYIVTGASSGIGKSLSKKLSQFANVVLASRDIQKLIQLSSEINHEGGSSLPVQTDITNLESCKNMITETVNHYGKIDALVLNAGVSMWARFDQIKDISLFNTINDVNYQGSVNCVYAAFDQLVENKGHIIAITTAQALIGFPNASAYSASKHALNGFLETLHMEIGSKIKISNVYLGWIKGTSLRANALGPNGKKIGSNHHKHSKRAIDIEVCTSKIIEGIKKNKKSIFVPSFLRLIPIAKLFLRTWLFRKIIKVTNQEEN